MKNLKKDEIYVVVDTPKKAKKLKKVLDMFGERVYTDERDFFNWCKSSNTVYFSPSEDEWHYKIGSIGHREKVSIKELKNILAVEHLKEGDVFLGGIGENTWLVKYVKSNHDFEGYYFIEDRLTEYTGYFDNFIRYATEKEILLLNSEEKQLLNPKKELEVGKWYKSPKGGLFCVTSFDGDEYQAYGFNVGGDWKDIGRFHEVFATNDTEATHQEVKNALHGESKRLYKIGDAVTQLDEANIGNYPYTENGSNFKIRDIDEPLLQIDDEGTRFYLGNLLVLKNGRWADVIEQAEVEPKPSLNIGDVVKLNNSQVAVVKDSKEAFKWRFCPKLSKEEVVELLFGKEEEVELIAGNWYEITNRENTLLQYNPDGGVKGWWDGSYGTWFFTKGGGLEECAIPASDEILKKFGVKKV